jgi:hypothetical protein
MLRQLSPLLLLSSVAAASGAVPVPRTFGNGVLSAIENSSHPSLLVLNHTLHPDSAYGVMTHYWSTGELVNWDTVIDYFVDGEETPSISLMEDMACGQGYPKAEFGTFNGNGAPYNGEGYPKPGTTGLFAAGEKMGKGGQVGGYYHYHKVLFRRSIRITARSLTKGEQVVYIVVRGHEVAKDTDAAKGLTMPSGFVVPPQAKLQLQRIDNVTYQPLEFAPLVELPRGYAGLMYMVTFATATVPAGNSYVRCPCRTTTVCAAPPMLDHGWMFWYVGRSKAVGTSSRRPGRLGQAWRSAPESKTFLTAPTASARPVARAPACLRTRRPACCTSAGPV